MAQLSVNVNKIATLRNSRGGLRPDLLELSTLILGCGVAGLTVHPRPDGRHIRRSDVYDLGALIADWNKHGRNAELNVEGYPSADFLSLIEEIRPDQVTLVPDPPDALTSNAGWAIERHSSFLASTIGSLRGWQIRTSLFVDPFTLDERELSALESLLPDRIELFTEAYAKSFHSPARAEVLERYIEAARSARDIGLGINAGHDLDLENLATFLRSVPHVAEVSIGHALISDALVMGLEASVRSYLKEAGGG
jgi:pyridoxine 5-phosphate synthase